MKFPIALTCQTCGAELSVTGYGDKKLPPAFCQNCKTAIFLVDPLSISIIADRLLYRSQAEIDSGDPTVSIICSAVAVEAALTEVFLKWKKIDTQVHAPTEAQLKEWEKEYKGTTKLDKSKRSGFEKSADFVSKFLTGKPFDEYVMAFVQKSSEAQLIKLGFADGGSERKSLRVHKRLFEKRNRIMHWGKVGYEIGDALDAFTAACDVISILKLMDKERCEAMERSWATE